MLYLNQLEYRHIPYITHTPWDKPKHHLFWRKVEQ